VVVALTVTGCGGHHRDKQLSPRDRVAYYQIATTSGLLRARSSSLLSHRRGAPPATLADARGRLALLHPDAATLSALRDQLAAAADRVLRTPTAAAARAAFAVTDHVNSELARWGKGRELKSLVPD